MIRSDGFEDADIPPDLRERYSDIRPLGEGGMGRVLSAHDDTLLIRVAIKLLQKKVDARTIVRFQQEARLLSKLNHQFIVRVMDFFYSKGGDFFLIMEMVNGDSLAALIEANDKLPVRECIRWSYQIGKALEHAHANAIVHRDLKPGNVMVNVDGNIKVLDFGIAKLLTESDQFGTMTRPGQIVGSPRFMSPEQLRGESATEQSDVYALGMLLFTMIAGTPPFDSENIVDALEQRMAGEIPSLDQYVADDKLCAELEELVLHALEPGQKDRFEDMTQFISAIEGALNLAEELEQNSAGTTGGYIHPSQTATGAQPVTTAKRRNPLLIWGSLALFIAAFSIFSLIIFWGKDETLPASKEMVGYQLENDVDEANKFTELGNRPRHRVPRTVREPVPPGFVEASEYAGPKGFWQPEHSIITDQLFQQLPKNRPLRLSFAANSTVTPHHLELLKDYQVKALDLAECKHLTEQHMSAISKIKSIIFLRLNNSNVTDGGIKQLASLTSLDRLQLESCSSIKDKAIDYIVSNHRNLRHIDVSSTGVTSSGVRRLAQLPKLRKLMVNKIPLKDVDLYSLNNQITELDAAGCGLTNATLQRLLDFPNLKIVDFMNNPVTADEAQGFLKKRADVTLHWMPDGKGLLPETAGIYNRD